MLFKSREKIMAEASKEASQSVKHGVAGKLASLKLEDLLLELVEPETRRYVSKIVGENVLTGVRQVLLARMMGVRYYPGTEYVFLETRRVIYGLFNVYVENSTEMKDFMDRMQNWRLTAYALYEPFQGSVMLSDYPTSLESMNKLDIAYEQLGYDLNGIVESSISGYLVGCMVYNKISNKADRVLLLSSYRFLKNSLVLDTDIPDPITYVTPGGELRVSPREGGPLLYDGFIKVAYSDPKLNKLSNEVSSSLLVHADEDEKRASTLTIIWKAVSPAVTSAVPSWYGMGRLEREAVRDAVVGAVEDLSSVYLGLKEVKAAAEKYAEAVVAAIHGEEYVGGDIDPHKVRKLERLVKAVLSAQQESSRHYSREKLKRSVLELIDALTKDIQVLPNFAVYRVPYMIAKIGERLGTGLDPRDVARYASQDDRVSSELREALLDFGILVTTGKARDLTKAASEGFESFANALKEMMNSEEDLTLASAYSLYYALGIPIVDSYTKVRYRVVKTENLTSVLGSTDIMSRRVRVEVPYAPDLNYDVSVGRLLLGYFDQAIERHLKILKERSRDYLKLDNESVYHSVIYIFSNVMFGRLPDEVKRLYEREYLMWMPALDRLSKVVHKAVADVIYLEDLYEDARGDINKLVKKLEKLGRTVTEEEAFSMMSGKLKEFFTDVKTVVKDVTNPRSDSNKQIYSLERHLLPQYISVLKERSIKAYDTLLSYAEGQTDKDLEEARKIANKMAETSKHFPGDPDILSITRLKKVMPRLAELLALLELKQRTEEKKQEEKTQKREGTQKTVKSIDEQVAQKQPKTEETKREEPKEKQEEEPKEEQGGKILSGNTQASEKI